MLKFHRELAIKMFGAFIKGANVSAAVSVIRRIPKELQQRYYSKAIEILYGEYNCNKETFLFFISDQACRKASDIIEFNWRLSQDNKLKSTAIYVLGKCSDAMAFENYFIDWIV